MPSFGLNYYGNYTDYRSHRERSYLSCLQVRGYPLEMVLAEKLATAIARGTVNTRWRDFVDLYALAMRHPVNGATFRTALDRVVEYQKVTLTPLAAVLVGYSEIGQARWSRG